MISAYLQLALSMAFVGINISIGKEIVEHVPVFLFSEFRFILASLILLPLLAMRGEWKSSWEKSEGKTLFWQSFFGVFLFSICMLYGVQWTTATSAGIITSTVPACIALFSYLLLREKIRSHQWVSILLSVVGISMITFVGGGANLEMAAMFGNLLVFLAVISEALFTIFAKRLSGRITPFQMTAAINTISLVLFLPFAIADFVKTDLSAVPLKIWLLMIYYAVTASVLSFVLWYRGVAKVAASTAGLFTGFMPISAALVSILFLGEHFTWAHGVGMLFVLAAIVAGTRSRMAQPVIDHAENG
ncbi:DMT family transporter [Brevibacillus ruminantium]|uniref:DMT family transporter n=1 Tax=Brevibacillus ruminantium TaxID=2950604 RepID=A0ABY4WM23_9BACL|nr:DMT family transporter [Brevibacillus ruminantium]USG68218.1 DMT family transporter [Brevibacillus ruminantium]